MTTLELVDLPADRLSGEVLVVPLFEDQRTLDGPAAVVDWRLDGLLSHMIVAGELSGKIGEQVALQANAKLASSWILVGGGGRWQTLDRDEYVRMTGRLLKMAAKAGMAELALCLPPTDGVDAAEIERIVRERLVGVSHSTVCRLSRISRLS